MEKSYSDLLKDPRWQKKRLKILERDGFKCKLCGDGLETLHVHHKKYIPGKNPWDYSNVYLITLCKHCHESISDVDLNGLNGLCLVSSDPDLSYKFYTRNGKDIGCLHILQNKWLVISIPISKNQVLEMVKLFKNE